MLSSSFTWFDGIFLTFVITTIVMCAIMYRYGYNIGFTEGRHQKRVARRPKDEKEDPDWATSVKIVNRRKRY